MTIAVDLGRKATKTNKQTMSQTQRCMHWYGGRNVLHIIYGYKRHTCNIGLVITHY